MQWFCLVVFYAGFLNFSLSGCFINPRLTCQAPIEGRFSEPFFVQATAFYRHADRGFNRQGNSCSLAKALFGSELFLRDVYLASRLSEAGLLIGDPSQPYGGTPEEQFIGKMAATKLLFFAEQRSLQGVFSFYSFPEFLRHEYWKGLFGCNAFFMRRSRLLDLDIYGGCPGVGNILGEDNIRQYFSTYNVDFTDFFKRAVLDPKGIAWSRHQSCSGIRALDLFGEIVYRMPDFLRPLDSALIGCDIEVMPPQIGTKEKQDVLWSAAITNGWRYATKFFGACFFESCFDFFNPFLFAAFEKRGPFATRMRSAQEKNQNSCIIRCKPFDALQIGLFNLPDSLVPAFSDQSFSVLIEPKTSFKTVFSNTIKNIFDTAWNVTVGVEYHKKRAPRIRFYSMRENPLFLGDVLALYRHSYTKLFFSLQLPQSQQVACSFGFSVMPFGANVLKKAELSCALSAYF